MTNPTARHSSSASIVVRAPRAAVWRALTEPAIVKQYFFGTDLVTDWKVGSPLFFRGEYDGKPYEDRGTVLAFEPERSLSYDYWSSMSGHEDKAELRHRIAYELAERDGGTEVVIRQSNVDTAERAAHSAENWKTVLAAMKEQVERG